MLAIKAKINRIRVESLVKDLRFATSPSFLKGISLDAEAKTVLSVLKKNFPKSSGADSASNKNEFGMHLVSGFRVTAFQSGSSVGFAISHLLEGNKRALAVLRSLDKGHRAYSYTSKEDVKFVGKRNYTRAVLKSSKFNWVTLAEGRTVTHSARAGEEYTDKTYTFVTTVMLPSLREKIKGQIKHRIERGR